MERIPHFINGALISDAERFGPVFNPATGEQEKEVALASAARVEEAIAAARAALPGLAGHQPGQAHRHLLQGPRTAHAAPAGTGRAPDQRARQGALRRRRRNHPRPGEHRIRHRTVPHAQGRALRAGLRRRRCPLGPPAGRRRRLHHPLQLPGHGAAVDDRQRPGLRQHRPAQAQRKGPVLRGLHRRAVRRGGPAGGVLNVVHGDKEAVDVPPGTPATSKPSASSAPRPIAQSIYKRGRRPRQARPGPGRREEPHGGPAGRGPGHGRGRRRLRRLRLRGGALHGRQRPRRRRQHRATSWWTRSAAAWPRSRSARARTRPPRWAR